MTFILDLDLNVTKTLLHIENEVFESHRPNSYRQTDAAERYEAACAYTLMETIQHDPTALVMLC